MMIFRFIYDEKYELEVYADNLHTAIKLVKENRRVTVKNPDESILKDLEQGLDPSKIKLLQNKIESLEVCNVEDSFEFRT